jgi:hypothetical protein
MTARYSRPALGEHERVDGSRVQVRRARTGDAGAVAGLAGELAQSFPFSREKVDLAQHLAPRRALTSAAS